MSEVIENTQDSTPNPDTDTELDLLKARAVKMGIKHHPSIGIDKLSAKIEVILSATPSTNAVPDSPIGVPIDYKSKADAAKRVEVRNKTRLRNKAAKLIRVRITCMNPNKKEWEGEIISVSNRNVGVFKEYVPFNAEDGWHLPQMIINVLEEKKCQVFTTVKNASGVKVRKGKLIKAYSIDYLPSLTQSEIDKLAQRQAMAKGQD